MKIAACADIHTGNFRQFGGALQSGINTRAHLALATLKLAYETAQERGCEVFVMAGDVFDNSRPSPQLIAEVQAIFGPKAERAIQVIGLVGNHDQNGFGERDHALAALQDHIDVVDAATTFHMPRHRVAISCLPFTAGAARDWLPIAVGVTVDKVGAGYHHVLVAHLGIEDDTTPVWLQGSRDAIPAATLLDLCANNSISTAIVGNWHEAGAWVDHDCTVVQCSALNPTGFNNPGFKLYGHMVVLDTDTNAVDFIQLPGPRFESIRVSTLDELQTFLACARDQYGDVVNAPTTYWRVTTDDAAVKPTLEWLQRSRYAIAAARMAASAARTADSLNAALHEFVQAMPLPDGVDRDRVLDRARRYLTV
jgi:DNA repair exonuclease SbcCD nuclease subunit